MSFLYADSFDNYANTVANMGIANWTLANSGGITMQTGAATQYSYGAAIAILMSTTATMLHNFGQNVGAITGTIRTKRTEGSLPNAANACYINFVDGTTNRCSIAIHGNGTVNVVDGGNAAYSGSPTLSANTNGTWETWQFRIVFNATTGSFNLRRNGATVDAIALTNINTSTSGFITGIRLTGDNGTSNTSISFDDLFLAIDDNTAPNGWIPPVRGYRQSLATSVQAQMTPTSGFTNITALNDSYPDDDTSTITSTSTGQQDIFTVTQSLANFTPFGVTATVRWKKTTTDALTPTLNLALGTGTATAVITDTAVQTAYATRTAWLQNDTTGTPWTKASLDSIRLGVQAGS